MGRKLGNLLIIYGILNFLASFLFGSVYIVIGAFLWMMLMIGLGSWQRGKAKSQEARERQTQALETMAYRNDNDKVQKEALADAINKILDEREGKKAT
jgi:hypothetical protein